MTEPKFPPKTNLTALRKARGMSIRALAAAINRDPSVILRLEKGRARYNETTLKAISEALGVSPQELLAEEVHTTQHSALSPTLTPLTQPIEERALFPRTRKSASTPYGLCEPTTGFGDDVELFVFDSVSRPPALPALGPTQFPYRIRSRVLDQIGLIPDDVAVFDISAERLKVLKNGDIVIAEHHDGSSVTTILRQFITPSLLITNSFRSNKVVLNIDADNVDVCGILVSSSRW